MANFRRNAAEFRRNAQPSAAAAAAVAADDDVHRPPPLNEEDNGRRLRLLFCASLIMLPPVVHRWLHLYLFSRLYRHTSASRRVPCVQLVVAFPGALASPSHRASARCLGFCHSSHLHLSSHPLIPRLFVALLGASPPLLSSQLLLVMPLGAPLSFGWFVALPLPGGLSYGWLSCFLSSRRCFLCIYAS